MNNAILTQSTEKSMTSLEISELVQSRHDSVKRTIENLVNQCVIAQPQAVDVQAIKGNNRNYTTLAYVFSGERGKLDSITVVAQLCPHFTARLVQRWYELEQQQTFNPAQLSRLEILQLAMQAEQENQALKQHIAVIEPQAHALQRITQMGEDLGFIESAKVLKINPKQLMNFLLERKWIYRDAKAKPQAYQEKIDGGYLIHHFTAPQQTAHGERVFSQVKITAKGVAKLATLLNQGAM